MTDGSYFSISQATQHGTISINSETGAWTYAPDDNFYGQDQAQITITDDLDGSSVIDFHFSVTPVEDPALIYGTTSTNRSWRTALHLAILTPPTSMDSPMVPTIRFPLILLMVTQRSIPLMETGATPLPSFLR